MLDRSDVGRLQTLSANSICYKPELLLANRSLIQAIYILRCLAHRVTSLGFQKLNLCAFGALQAQAVQLGAECNPLTTTNSLTEFYAY